MSKAYWPSRNPVVTEEGTTDVRIYLSYSTATDIPVAWTATPRTS